MVLASSRKQLVTFVAVCLVVIGTCQTAAAQEKQSLADMQATGKLKIKTWIEPTQAIVVNQQVNFVIEVATEQWFSGGTRIGRLEIDDAIVLQREQFAVNSTRREQGLTWSVQQWSISIYPQRDGAFHIPALRLALSVAGEDGKPVSGEVYTRPVSFKASVPQALAALSSTGETNTTWVASPAFSVEESYSQSQATELQKLQPGDALQRTITFTAENVAAMMLPTIRLREQEGLASYQKPPRLQDNINRGVYRAERVETITYVLEKPGHYVLPEMAYYWWDLTSQSLKTIKLPAQRISTLNADRSAAARPGQQRTPREWALLSVKVGIPLLLIILFWMFWRQRRSKTTTAVLTGDERVLRKKLLQASRRGDTQQAISFLYQWLDHYQNERFDGSIRRLLEELHRQELKSMFEPLMQRVYANSEIQVEADIERFVHVLDDELRSAKLSTRWNIKPVPLELN